MSRADALSAIADAAKAAEKLLKRLDVVLEHYEKRLKDKA